MSPLGIAPQANPMDIGALLGIGKVVERQCHSDFVNMSSGDNGREPADHQEKRDGNSNHLNAIVASLIFIAFSVVQRGKRA
jgi:hypothetical protein